MKANHQNHTHGLQFDLERLANLTINRRRALFLTGLGGTALLTGCVTDKTATPSSSPTAGANLALTSCAEINDETAGPYPADGSQASRQTLNALSKNGILRSDIRTSLTTGHTAAGIPLKIVLKLVNVNAGCAPLANYAIYLWHCDRDGNYSLYSQGITNEDYLRGVQQTDRNGIVSFSSIFPACYMGRWPHIHFEVYPSVAKATKATNSIKTSQLAMPKDVCDKVYATPGYESSVNNLASISLASDNVFGDDQAKYQLSSVTGNVKDGFVATLVVGIAV